LVLSFDRVVPKKEKVRDLGDLIAAEEREAIAAWVIAIVREVTNQPDYTLPESHKKLMNQLAWENDTVFFYLTSEEGPRKTENASSTVLLADLYERYSSFCYATAHAKPVGLRVFLTRLNELGNFMGFSVSGLTVFGITMEKDRGESLQKNI
jgi:hypothetical protein